MHTATRALVALTALVAASCGTTVPALADVPRNVHDGPTAGKLDAGWVRAACASTDDGVKCAIRIPEGARTVVLEHRLGGKRLGVERTYPYADDHRAGPAPARHVAGRVIPGVRLECDSAGQRVECVLDLAARFGDFNVTTFVNGWSYGGLRGEGVVL